MSMKPDPEIVALLEEELERARSGDTTGILVLVTEDKTLGTVPVNFLADLDITGGNSGSATLNAKGELTGVVFDGTIDGVISDWAFDPAYTRSIHVDVRYMLWVLDTMTGAKRLLDEMNVKSKATSTH